MIGSLIGKMADAQKMSIAQIQQSIASGSLPSYIGIPLLQEKAQQAQKLQMAQAILKEQGTPDVTVKDQVMQAADQVTRPEPPVMPSTPDGYRQQPAPSQGVEALASNMPEEYAGGGIIAFADRGVVPGAEDVHIPGKRDDEDTRVAGLEPLREAPVRGREGRSARDLEAITPYGVDRPISGGYEPYTPPTESYGDTLSRLGSGVKDFLSSTIEPMGGESEGAMRRRMARESYYDTTTPPPSMRNLGVTPISGGISVLPKDAFTPSSMREEAAPAGPWAMDKVLNTTPERAAGPTPAAPKDNGLVIHRDVAAPGFGVPPAAQEADPFSGIDDLLNRRAAESKISRDQLREIIVGQQADRAEREKRNLGMSLIEAGGGMMAGESPFAGVNIGRGVMTGAKSYARGVEQLQQDDAKVVNQLVALGLRGEELDNAAAKMGVDLAHMRQMAPYYSSMARQHQVSAALAPDIARSEAEARYNRGIADLAHARYFSAEAADLPEKRRIEELRALRPTGSGAGGVAGMRVDPQVYKARTEDRKAMLADPTGFPEVLVALRKRPDAQRILDALENPKSKNYAWAQQELMKIVDPIIEKDLASSKVASQPNPYYDNEG